MKRTRVPPNVKRSTKLQGAQRSPEYAFRGTDFVQGPNLVTKSSLAKKSERIEENSLLQAKTFWVL